LHFNSDEAISAHEDLGIDTTLNNQFSPMNRTAEHHHRVEAFKKAKVLQTMNLKTEQDLSSRYQASDLDIQKTQLTAFPAEIGEVIEEANRKVSGCLQTQLEEISRGFTFQVN